MTTAYRTYLKTPEWDGRRRQALYDAGYRCERCGAASPLDVHHLTYRNIFNEAPEDLQALCRPCHNWIHMVWWQKAAILSVRVLKWVWYR